MTGTDPIAEARRLLERTDFFHLPSPLADDIRAWLAYNPDNNTPGARSNATIGQGNDRAEASYGKTGSATLPTGANPEKPAAGVTEATPGARWREEGKPDPHVNHYDVDRARLAGGQFTDDEVAFKVGMLSPRDLDHEAVLSMAKDRIRWLSRALASASPAAQDRIPEGMVLVPKVAIDWLMGETPDHKGLWFLPNHNAYGAYWWRSRFTEICAELAAPAVPPTPLPASPNSPCSTPAREGA